MTDPVPVLMPKRAAAAPPPHPDDIVLTFTLRLGGVSVTVEPDVPEWMTELGWSAEEIKFIADGLASAFTYAMHPSFPRKGESVLFRARPK